MIVWVVYDIGSNKARRNASKYCLNKGLYRVQKSIFLGEINKNDKDELRLILEDICDKEKDSIFIVPADRDNIHETQFIGKGFEKELVCNEVISKFI